MADHSVAGNVFTRTNARILLRGQYVLFIGGKMAEEKNAVIATVDFMHV